MPGDLWRESNTMSPAYQQSVGVSLYRRSLYTVWKRTAPMPNMSAFDAPSREVCVIKRSNTGTPQQGFVLLNDTHVQENVEIPAPTVSHMNIPEGPMNPIMLQGDHGPVAFRDLYLRGLDLRDTVR